MNATTRQTDEGQYLVRAGTLIKLIFHPDDAPTEHSITNWVKEGRIPYVRAGGRIFFNPAKVRAALEAPVPRHKKRLKLATA